MFFRLKNVICKLFLDKLSQYNITKYDIKTILYSPLFLPRDSILRRPQYKGNEEQLITKIIVSQQLPYNFWEGEMLTPV